MDAVPGTHSPEVHVPLPERGPFAVEATPERASQPAAAVPEVQPVDLPSSPVILAPPVAANAPTDPMVKRVEDILSDGMGSAYASMDQVTQQKFKAVGETTAVTITRMLGQTKIQVKKIVQLILVWLRIIPNVNAFYLEQEAKIKTDALMRMNSNRSLIPPPQ